MSERRQPLNRAFLPGRAIFSGEREEIEQYCVKHGLPEWLIRKLGSGRYYVDLRGKYRRQALDG